MNDIIVAMCQHAENGCIVWTTLAILGAACDLIGGISLIRLIRLGESTTPLVVFSMLMVPFTAVAIYRARKASSLIDICRCALRNL
jgi:hypothetical protein